MIRPCDARGGRLRKDNAEMMTANFMESLKVMGFGMLGIFTVAVVLIVIMKVLVKLFPAKS